MFDTHDYESSPGYDVQSGVALPVASVSNISSYQSPEPVCACLLILSQVTSGKDLFAANLINRLHVDPLVLGQPNTLMRPGTAGMARGAHSREHADVFDRRREHK